MSVVIPCYNEAATIREVIRRVLASPLVGELIVVDDASRDGSSDLVTGLGDPRIRLLIQPRNMGKGAALRRGLIEAQLPFVVIQDADLEYSPGDYPGLLQPLIEDRADVVYGSRFHSSRPHRVLYYWHSVGNKLLTTASNMVTNLNLTDMETCYKMFRREVLQDIEIDEDRFGFEPEITAKIARGGWRIFEVGIGYDGRTYAEGKKIGWRDGVRALYCIARYGLAPRFFPADEANRASGSAARFDVADRELQGSLESLEDAKNYADWLVELIAPYLRGNILEVGAGLGTLSERLAGHGHVVASELSLTCVQRLREKFGGHPAIEVVEGEGVSGVGDRKFESIVLVNVLEHIEDDAAALGKLEQQLLPGGHLLLFVPAFEALMSDFDRSIGHHRRYHRARLIGAVYRAGLEVVEARYVNTVGAAIWWAFTKKLGGVPTKKWPVRLFDKAIVPWLRKLETGRVAPFGQSLLLVARRPSTEPAALV